MCIRGCVIRGCIRWCVSEGEYQRVYERVSIRGCVSEGVLSEGEYMRGCVSEGVH